MKIQCTGQHVDVTRHLATVPEVALYAAPKRNVSVNACHHGVDVLPVRVIREHVAEVVNEPAAFVYVTE